MRSTAAERTGTVIAVAVVVAGMTGTGSRLVPDRVGYSCVGCAAPGPEHGLGVAVVVGSSAEPCALVGALSFHDGDWPLPCTCRIRHKRTMVDGRRASS